jgi:hypothetical protein
MSYNYADFASANPTLNISRTVANTFLQILGILGMTKARLFAEPKPGSAGPTGGVRLVPDKAQPSDPTDPSLNDPFNPLAVDVSGEDVASSSGNDGSPIDYKAHIAESSDYFDIAPFMHDLLMAPSLFSPDLLIPYLGFRLQTILHTLSIGAMVDFSGFVANAPSKAGVVKNLLFPPPPPPPPTATVFHIPVGLPQGRFDDQGRQFYYATVYDFVYPNGFSWADDRGSFVKVVQVSPFGASHQWLKVG